MEDSILNSIKKKLPIFDQSGEYFDDDLIDHIRQAHIRANDGSECSNDKSIPDDWHNSVKTLEDDINREIERMREEYPDDYYRLKRPIL